MVSGKTAWVFEIQAVRPERLEFLPILDVNAGHYSFRWEAWVWKVSFWQPGPTGHPISTLRVTAWKRLHRTPYPGARSPRSYQSVSPPAFSCWDFVCCLESLNILHWCFFIFNTLLSLCASGKMVKKVCPCNQLCSNYLFFLLLLVLDCKACYPWVLWTLKPHNSLIPNFHLSSSAPFSNIVFNMLNYWPLAVLQVTVKNHLIVSAFSGDPCEPPSVTVRAW